MKTIVVDDELNNIEAFEMEAEGIKEIEIVGKFQDAKEALAYAKTAQVDLAVLDVEMPEINGILLGYRLRAFRPDIALIYVTGYKQYAFDAFRLEASAYILKPYDRMDLERAIIRAARLMGWEEPVLGMPRVFIRTFGRFEVFVNDRPVEFKSSKAKEFLALMVDRKGGIVTTEEMLTYLWEEKPDDDSSRSLCRKVTQRLHSNLAQYGIEDILIRHNRGRSLDLSKVTCDYYLYLEGSGKDRPVFDGEYMSNYSWSEETLSKLMKMEYTM